MGLGGQCVKFGPFLCGGDSLVKPGVVRHFKATQPDGSRSQRRDLEDPSE